MRNKFRSGISLIALSVVVIILLIFSSISVITTVNFFETTKRTSFVETLSTVQGAISNYYTSTGTLPIKEGTTAKTSAEMISLYSDDDTKSEFTNELNLNGDSSSTFYTIDVGLLGIKDISLSLGEDQDAFVISTNGNMAYYAPGKKINDETFFSLSTRLMPNKKVIDLDVTVGEVAIGEEIELEKNINVWTNELEITALSNLSETQSIYYYMAGVTTAVRESADGKIVVNAESMTEDEKTSFLSGETNKILTVQKKEGSTVVKEGTLSISNLDIQAPTLQSSELTDTSSTEFNKIKIVATDLGNSGVKNYIYVYNTKVDFSGEVINVYNGEETPEQRLLHYGNISKTGEFKIDKNIASIYAVAVDGAGNISPAEEYTIDSQYISAM